MEYMFPPTHSQKILWKSEHFPWRYTRKREWVFFSEHIWLQTWADRRLSLSAAGAHQLSIFPTLPLTAMNKRQEKRGYTYQVAYTWKVLVFHRWDKWSVFESISLNYCSEGCSCWIFEHSYQHNHIFLQWSRLIVSKTVQLLDLWKSWVSNFFMSHPPQIGNQQQKIIHSLFSQYDNILRRYSKYRVNQTRNLS